MTANGASRPLRRLPAMVSFLSPKPALSLDGGNHFSCPFAATRCDQRRRPMIHLCGIRSTPFSRTLAMSPLGQGRRSRAAVRGSASPQKVDRDRKDEC
jgi:hypothetical protein